MALIKASRNHLNWSNDPMNPTWIRQERMKTILFCYWDLSQNEKWMPPSPPNWDGLPM